VFATGVFSYIQSSSAASLMEDFANFIPKQCHVHRGGEKKEIAARELVIGDIVYLTNGQQIPADVILFQVNEMKVNNASLTGEAEELLRSVDPELLTANVFESANVAFFGTNCTLGNGKGVVFRTGDDTAIGLIANLTQSAEAKQTPLSHEIERFIILISIVAVVLGVTFFLYGLIIVKYSPIDMLVFAIGIIVANVPEGLLATVTVSLALTAGRMYEKMVLVKNLESVETLGSTSCICSDKTGTLTQNRMTVSQMFLNRKVMNCEVNMETYTKKLAEEKEKFEKSNGQDGEPDKGVKPEYDIINDNLLKRFIHTLALSTVTYFSFSPKDDDIKQWVKLYNKKDTTKKKITPSLPSENVELNAAQQAALDEAKRLMIDEEDNRRFLKRSTIGDASETGIVRWITPALMKDYGGSIDVPDIKTNALEIIRAQYPI
jgi:magnesium-transporting ATPase (P-type)